MLLAGRRKENLDPLPRPCTNCAQDSQGGLFTVFPNCVLSDFPIVAWIMDQHTKIAFRGSCPHWKVFPAPKNIQGYQRMYLQAMRVGGPGRE